jgi:hypothetical protein
VPFDRGTGTVADLSHCIVVTWAVFGNHWPSRSSGQFESEGYRAIAGDQRTANQMASA